MTEWVWYCRHCEQVLERGEDAVACDDPAGCIRTDEWGGDACGYIVCRHCRRPASEIGENVAERRRRGDPA
jgi:hypothetical protein